MELFVAGEYSLTNYSALQAVLNYMEDHESPSKEKLGRVVTPNDLHPVMLRIALLYYLVCKNSGFYKIAIDSTDEDEVKVKIVNPICAFVADTLAQTMQSTKAIGSMLSAYDLANSVLAAIKSFDPEKDPEAKKLAAFVETVSDAILTPTVRQIVEGNQWVDKTNSVTISKLIFKSCVFSYMAITINGVIKDAVKKHLPMGVFLNTLMVGSHCISSLAIEERTTDESTSFADCGTQLTHAAGMALCLMFQSADSEKEDPAYRFIPNAFENISKTYNLMAEQVNVALKETQEAAEDNAEALEMLSIFTPEEIENGKAEINKMIGEDIKARNQEVPLEEEK